MIALHSRVVPALYRFALPLGNAFILTAVLLYLMFLLVKIDQPELAGKNVITLPPITRMDEESELRQIIHIPKKPPVIEEQPRLLKLVEINRDEDIDSPGLGINFKPDPISDLYQLDNSQLVLALGYPPNYPPGAISRRIEGYAVVGFSVSASGAVYDAFVIESEPSKVFDRASLKAISKFKYKPRMENGKAIATQGQRYMFTYKLES